VGVFLITAALIAAMAGCNGDGYTPPPTENLEIRTWSDLDAVRGRLDGDHVLMNDLDSTTAGYAALASQTAHGGKGWEPIDNFRGSFDGQGYEIRDLFVDRPREDYVGLFGSVEVEGVIQDIGVVSATVIGAKYVGGLAGLNSGTVSDCCSNGSVIGDEYVGGLVGRNLVPASTLPIKGIVSNSYSTGSVTGNRWVGGLMGENLRGTVSNSYSTVGVTGYGSVGGLIGINREAIVSDCYFAGSVTGTTGVGGLVGDSCYDHGYGDGDGSAVSNSYYNYDEVLINGENIITRGALFGEDFDQWLANGRFLDVNQRLSQEDGYYVVNRATDLKVLLAFSQNAPFKFRLKSDLDLGDDLNFYIPYFAGEFDGNGHKIYNLSFNFDFVYAVGLFGYLAPGGKVTDLAVENVNITGDESVGGLVGFSAGTVSDSYCTGSVTGQGFVGGLVGHDWYLSAVTNSHFTGTVAGDCNVGGLVGQNMGTVSDCYSNGNVSGISWSVGGLVGHNGGTVSSSYSTASVVSDNNVGGLVGENGGDGTVSNCYSSGDVTSYDNVAGGLVGGNYGTVSNSYSTGSVTGSSQVGGLVGVGTGSNSFWDTQTSGQATSDGGTGKTTAEMKSIATFSGAGWNMIAVANPGTCNPSYIWNIVNGVTYPFLSWQR